MFNSTFSNNFNELLKRFAFELDGNFIIGKYDNQDSVIVEYKQYQIIFDSYIYYSVVSGSTLEKEYYRVRVEFNSPDKIYFKLANQGFIENIQKFLGYQDLKIGNDSFDKKFIIKSNNDYKVQLILSDEEIQQLIFKLKSATIEVFEKEGLFGEKITEGNSLLCLFSEEEIIDISLFYDILALIKSIIDKLESLASAKSISI